MSRIKFDILVRTVDLCLKGRYFQVAPSLPKEIDIRTYFSKSLVFSILVQVRTKKNRLLSSFANILLIYLYQSDVGKNAIIGETVFFPHPSGIVIGSGTSLDGQIIVFDRTSFGKKYPGTNCGMPQIHGEGVIGSGAKILGDVNVSGKFVIGANTVLVNDLKNQTYTGEKFTLGVYFENTTS